METCASLTQFHCQPAESESWNCHRLQLNSVFKIFSRLYCLCVRTVDGNRSVSGYLCVQADTFGVPASVLDQGVSVLCSVTHLRITLVFDYIAYISRHTRDTSVRQPLHLVVRNTSARRLRCCHYSVLDTVVFRFINTSGEWGNKHPVLTTYE